MELKMSKLDTKFVEPWSSQSILISKFIFTEVLKFCFFAIDMQSTLPTTATETEKSGQCREVAVTGR